MQRCLGVLFVLTAASITACSPTYKGIPPVVGPKDTAESVLGERIFREPRFSKFFVRQTGGNPNARLTEGDPALKRLPGARRGELASPFGAQAMSCVACHMVDDAQTLARAGMRGYADFGARSPIPLLPGDPHTMTPRNSPVLLGAFINNDPSLRPEATPFLLHYDGEFTTIDDLIVGGYTGRNFGWLPGEKAEALANIVKVIREDDGTDPLELKFSNRFSYRQMLRGDSQAIPSRSLLAADRRMDVMRADDDAILNKVVDLVKTYLLALQFATDPVTGIYNGSPYDAFLLANKLPAQPDPGETSIDYAGRLAWAMQGLGRPTFVQTEVGSFGAKELDGARIFLARSQNPAASAPGYFQVGNCVSCHAPPHFTDFKFHNTGATQDEYDGVHGRGAFAKLYIPGLVERNAAPNKFLPATGQHPSANGRFRAPPSAAQPGYTDLGAWNIFANPDFPAPQVALQTLLGSLDSSVATFKTPGLRGLSLSDPYLHGGTKANLGETLRFYQDMSKLQRAGTLRNGDPELALIDIDAAGVKALEAFLNSLNEVYE